MTDQERHGSGATGILIAETKQLAERLEHNGHDSRPECADHVKLTAKLSMLIIWLIETDNERGNKMARLDASVGKLDRTMEEMLSAMNIKRGQDIVDRRNDREGRDRVRDTLQLNRNEDREERSERDMWKFFGLEIRGPEARRLGKLTYHVCMAAVVLFIAAYVFLRRPPSLNDLRGTMLSNSVPTRITFVVPENKPGE